MSSRSIDDADHPATTRADGTGSGPRLQLDRREAIGIIGAAATAGVVGGLTGGPREARARERAGTLPGSAPIRKALKYGMIGPGGSIEEKFRIARACGFDGVELDSPNDFTVDEVVAAIERTGVVVPGVVDSVHWAKPLSDPDPSVRAEGRRALEAALRDAKAYGATTVLLVPAIVNKSVRYEDAYARSQEQIRLVLPLAEELGVRIAIENVWNSFLLSPMEAARYTDELGPMVGWHFDPGNVVNFGWPEDWIRTLGPRILKLDVKEYSRKRRDDDGLWKGFDVPILEGDCDWPAIMNALGEVGYSGGWMAAEVAGGDEARLRDVASRMDRIIAMGS